MKRRAPISFAHASAASPQRRRFLATSLGVAGAALTAGCATPYSDSLALEQWPPIGSFAQGGGVSIHYWERGAATGDGPPVVLIHGANGNLRDWTFSIAPRIAERRRVIAMDRPGLGYSERPTEGGSDPRVQARSLRGAADALGAERPILVGHSWGAAVALAWALERPDDVAGVVVVSGVANPYTGAAKFFGALGVDDLIVSLYSEYLKSTVDDGGVERFVQRVFRPQTPPPGYAEYVGGPLALRQSSLRANAEDIADLNDALLEMAEGYASLRTPVELLHGTEDFISVDAQSQPLSEILPNARLTLLEGVGHMAHHADTDALIAAIDRLAGRDQVDA